MRAEIKDERVTGGLVHLSALTVGEWFILDVVYGPLQVVIRQGANFTDAMFIGDGALTTYKANPKVQRVKVCVVILENAPFE